MRSICGLKGVTVSTFALAGCWAACESGAPVRRWSLNRVFAGRALWLQLARRLDRGGASTDGALQQARRRSDTR